MVIIGLIPGPAISGAFSTVFLSSIPSMLGLYFEDRSFCFPFFFFFFPFASGMFMNGGMPGGIGGVGGST